jgi:hypothetical protein
MGLFHATAADPDVEQIAEEDDARRAPAEPFEEFQKIGQRRIVAIDVDVPDEHEISARPPETHFDPSPDSGLAKNSA